MFTRLPWLSASFVTIVVGIFIAFIVGWKLAIIVVSLVPLLVGAGYFQFKMQRGHKMQDMTQLELAGKVIKCIKQSTPIIIGDESLLGARCVIQWPNPFL